MTSDERSQQRRAHFRLLYPTSARPKMRSGGQQHEVVEIAEGGIRIVVSRGEAMQLGDSFGGDICFHDALVEHVEGEVFRLDNALAVIKLSTGLSLHRVMLEQAYIHKTYPKFVADNRQKKP